MVQGFRVLEVLHKTKNVDNPMRYRFPIREPAAPLDRPAPWGDAWTIKHVLIAAA